jgi:hypothetical protein
MAAQKTEVLEPLSGPFEHPANLPDLAAAVHARQNSQIGICHFPPAFAPPLFFYLDSCFLPAIEYQTT